MPCTPRGAWRRERDSNPRSPFKGDTRLAGEPLRPLGHLSVSNISLAEGVGFEPTSPFGEAVFKTAALNHSAIPPLLQSIFSQNFIHYRLLFVFDEGVGCARSPRSLRLPRPWRGRRAHVRLYGESRFRRDALNHSAIPPLLQSAFSQNLIHYRLLFVFDEGVGCARSLRLPRPWRGRRTHVPFRRSGFQDRRLKPLGHPSVLTQSKAHSAWSIALS